MQGKYILPQMDTAAKKASPTIERAGVQLGEALACSVR